MQKIEIPYQIVYHIAINKKHLRLERGSYYEKENGNDMPGCDAGYDGMR